MLFSYFDRCTGQLCGFLGEVSHKQVTGTDGSTTVVAIAVDFWWIFLAGEE